MVNKLRRDYGGTKENMKSPEYQAKVRKFITYVKVLDMFHEPSRVTDISRKLGCHWKEVSKIKSDLLKAGFIESCYSKEVYIHSTRSWVISTYYKLTKEGEQLLFTLENLRVLAILTGVIDDLT